MTHKIVRRRKARHNCDTRQIGIVVENAGLSTGTVVACEKCRQLWYYTSVDEMGKSYRLTPITRWDLFALRFGAVTFR